METKVLTISKFTGENHYFHPEKQVIPKQNANRSTYSRFGWRGVRTDHRLKIDKETISVKAPCNCKIVRPGLIAQQCSRGHWAQNSKVSEDPHTKFTGHGIPMNYPLMRAKPFPISTCIEAMQGYGRKHTTRAYSPCRIHGLRVGDIALAVD